MGVAPTPGGGGYWMLEADGAVHGFGNAAAVGLAAGSRPSRPSPASMTALIPDFSGRRVHRRDGSGQAFAYGDAPYFGDVTTVVSGYSGRAVGIAATPG